MFKNPEPLNPERHADLRYEPNIGYRFAANEKQVPVVSGEAVMAARDYTLVFDKSDPVLYAVLAVEENANAYVNDRGQWVGRYQPAFVRAYPFALVETPGQAPTAEGQRSFTVVVDADAPQFGDPDGERFFDVDGKPTALLAKVQEVLSSLYADSLRTRHLVTQLSDAGLLVERSMIVQSKEHALTGFRVVDVKALYGLTPEALVGLRDSGALTVAYAQLMSMTNLTDSVLARSVRSEGERAGDRKVRELFDGDFDIDLDFMN